jgi:hypothetical protein
MNVNVAFEQLSPLYKLIFFFFIFMIENYKMKFILLDTQRRIKRYKKFFNK